jgi:hypothetical protein
LKLRSLLEQIRKITYSLVLAAGLVLLIYLSGIAIEQMDERRFVEGSPNKKFDAGTTLAVADEELTVPGKNAPMTTLAVYTHEQPDYQAEEALFEGQTAMPEVVFPNNHLPEAADASSAHRTSVGKKLFSESQKLKYPASENSSNGKISMPDSQNNAAYKGSG